MSDFSAKRYSIDAGYGKKMEGCPYSLFEDGRDVQDYIIPPKGYKFVGFQCILLPENHIYDGKLVAQFEKEPLSKRMMAYAKYVVITLAILLVIGIIITLFVRTFPQKKTPTRQKPQPAAETPAPVKATDTLLAAVTTDSLPPLRDTATIGSTPQAPSDTETAAVAVSPDIAFKQEFWGLIHRCETSMDTYHGLYDKYKSQGVSGVEFEYLRITILKDWNTYKTWYQKLKKIPTSDLQKLETVNELIEKLNEQ